MTSEEVLSAKEELDKLWRSSQYIEAKKLAYVLLEQREIQENPKSLANVYYTLGIVYWYLSEYTKAINNYNIALQINEDIGNKDGIALNLGNIGIVYMYLTDYQTALEYYARSLKVYEEINKKDGIASSFGNIGIVYLYLSDYHKALEYCKKSLQINQELGLKSDLARNYSNIGAVYHYLMEYSKDIEYQSKALEIHKEIQNKEGIANNLGNIGNVYFKLQDYSTATEYILQSLAINEEISNKVGTAHNLLNIATVYGTQESTVFNPQTSEEYLQKSLQIANEIDYKVIKKEVYELLHSLRLYEGHFENALEFYKKSIEIEKEIQSEEAKNKAVLFDQRRKIEEDEKARQVKLARFQEQEKILHNILPVNIADRILNQEVFIADHFNSVSVLFMDLVGFTSLSSIAPPKQLVYLLDSIFTKADEIVESFGLEKIKTIGDGYLAVANVTTPLEDHQKATALAALKLLETMMKFAVKIPSKLGMTDWMNSMNEIQIRIGIHTGEVVAGIIGKNKYTYDLWGDAVNVASRMESYSEAGRIHVSSEFAKSITSYPEFVLIPRGEITVKGKGTMNTYWLEMGKSNVK